jgi:glycerate dehydrogenase
MKIVFLDATTLGSDVDLDVFNQFGKFLTYPTTSKEQTLKHIDDAQIVLTNKVIIDKEIMDKCKNLKLICITATGMNNVDLEYAKEKEIEVKNVAGYSTASVTQTTFSLVLFLISQSRFYNDYTKSGEWAKSPIFTNIDRPYFELKDKKWGIIGFGTIGKSVAKVADAFGCEVVYYSTSGANNDPVYARVELEDMLRNCDIISIHAPLNDKTNGLIKKAELDLMKEGAVLVNMGRGGIVDEDDLAYAVDNNNILAGLDVTCVEPINADNKLLSVKKKDNLVITPHIAWASLEARISLISMVADNIREYLKKHTI